MHRHVRHRACGLTLEPEVQEALMRDRRALDAERLANITGQELQRLLFLQTAMPAQDERAGLLREVRL